ncbi:MAG: nitrophenyl compound nitroreductase subunit ArsF family protein [Bacteroidales bacterium]|nr:nitrophenyl compound nitroreductase subunit ArsF family protein [Bacteroidales bacterium]
MKKIIFLPALLMLGLFFLSNPTSAQESETLSTQVDVYYFHATKRCPTCEAIEKETKKTLNGTFADQLDSGILKFHVLNLDDKENKELVEKYEIYGSSLILVPVSGDEVVNLTTKAFMYAKDQPFAFRKELRQKLSELLN